MINEPSGETPKKRVHPLERQPLPPSPDDRRRTRTTLHIASVPPRVTYGLIIINVLIFIMRAVSPYFDQQALAGALNSDAVLRGGEYYRLITSMFLHAGVYTVFDTLDLSGSAHVFLNMYFLYVIGAPQERLFGHVRFAAIYLLGGLTGGVLSILVNPPTTYSWGASGAVFAVLGAQAVYLYQHRRLLGRRGQSEMRSLAFTILINFAFGIINNLDPLRPQIGNWAHFGGLVGGVFLAWFTAPYFIFERHPDLPDDLLAEDVNPLRKRSWVYSLYLSALLIVLIIVSRSVRGF